MVKVNRAAKRSNGFGLDLVHVSRLLRGQLLCWGVDVAYVSAQAPLQDQYYEIVFRQLYNRSPIGPMTPAGPQTYSDIAQATVNLLMLYADIGEKAVVAERSKPGFREYRYYAVSPRDWRGFYGPGYNLDITLAKVGQQLEEPYPYPAALPVIRVVPHFLMYTHNKRYSGAAWVDQTELLLGFPQEDDAIF